LTWVLFIMIFGSTGVTAEHVAGFGTLQECRAAAQIIKDASPTLTPVKAACVSQQINKGT
jgi:hypothetical protein